MGKKRRILLAGLLLAVLGFVVWDALRLREPWYHWKSLSSWLEVYGPGPRGYRPSPEADEALRHIGTNAVPHLLRRLHSTNATARGTSVPMSAAYSQTFVMTKASVKVRLMMWVENHSPIRFHHIRAPASWDHWQAYLGFQALGSLGKAAIPDLVKLAHDPSGTSFLGNVQGTKDIGMVAKLAVSSSTFVAVGESPFKWRGTNSFLVDGEIAACSLAAIGADGVPPLMELLDDPNPHLKARAAVALGMIGGASEPAVPELVKSLKNPDVMVRIVSADAMGWIGKQSALAVPALTEALNDPEIGVKCWAADSLGRFRESATSAIPDLLASFAARDYRIRGSAAVALSKISPDTTAKEVVPVLLRQFKDANPGFRNGAVMDLGRLHMLPEVLIPVFITALEDSDDLVRMNAIHALEWFGPEAKAAVPKLILLRTDQNPFVREYAVKALMNIAPDR